MTTETVLVNKLTKKRYTITTAESCTGGLLSGTIVNVDGASKVLNCSFVTYSNEAKETGPGGGTPEKPVGLVYIGCALNGGVMVERHEFQGNRSQVRQKAVCAAMELAISCLDKGVIL